MKTAGIIYFSSVYEKTGAGKVVKSFLDEKDTFLENGIDRIEIYTPYGASDSETVKTKSTDSKSVKAAIKARVKKVLNSNYWGSCINIDHTIFQNGKKAVEDYFRRSKKDEDMLIFHELGSCFEYIKYCKKNRIKRKPYILIEHTNGFPWKMTEIYYPNIVGTKYREKLERRSDLCEKLAKYIVFVSDVSRANGIMRKPEYEKKMYSIPNGIRSLPEDFKERSYETVRLVTVGTVCSRKNQIALVDCVARIKDPDISLTVIGAGNALDDCKNRANSLGVEKQVFFLGEQDNIPLYLDQANVFIMASLDEGLPIAAIEALRSGMPLILTDVGGCKELIDHNGLLVNPEVEELCEAIKHIRDNKEEAAEMARHSYELFINKYSVGSMMAKYSELIKRG